MFTHPEWQISHKKFRKFNFYADVKALFQQTKMSKFLEGLLPAFKQQTLMKDPQIFQEALHFVELLQSNSFESNSSGNKHFN